MTTFVAVTKQDFVETGKRFNSEEIVNEIDRLHPLAAADIAVLSEGGYSQTMLDELAGFGEHLRLETADRRKLGGAKQGARAGELEAMKNGTYTLRLGIAVANVAISRRQVPPGEDVEVTREKLAELASRVKVLSGYIGLDSAVLRSRLEALKATLALPGFEPPKGDEQLRSRYLAQLDAAIARLGDLAESKKSLQDGAKDKTVSLEELNGRAYANLRLLTQAGRPAFKKAGDPEHARLYVLRNLYRRSAKAAPATGAPATPAPDPSPPKQAVPQPTQNQQP